MSKIFYEVRYTTYWYECHRVTEDATDEYDTLEKAIDRAADIKLCAELYHAGKHKEMEALQKKREVPDVYAFKGLYKTKRLPFGDE